MNFYLKIFYANKYDVFTDYYVFNTTILIKMFFLMEQDVKYFNIELIGEFCACFHTCMGYEIMLSLTHVMETPLICWRTVPRPPIVP